MENFCELWGKQETDTTIEPIIDAHWSCHWNMMNLFNRNFALGASFDELVKPDRVIKNRFLF